MSELFKRTYDANGIDFWPSPATKYAWLSVSAAALFGAVFFGVDAYNGGDVSEEFIKEYGVHVDPQGEAQAVGQLAAALGVVSLFALLMSGKRYPSRYWETGV